MYSVDTHFFDSIDTEEKAYILGYILADGHVASDNHIMFGLHEKDVDILYKIRDSMRTEAPILSKRGKPYKTLDIGSKFMCDVLRNYGFSNTRLTIKSQGGNKNNGHFSNGTPPPLTNSIQMLERKLRGRRRE